MAWKTMDVQEQRVQFVVAASRKEKTFSALCQEFGISRPTGMRWRERYEQAGLAGIAERSRATAAESHPDADGVGAAGGGDAATLSRLGSAQAASAAGARGSGVDAQHAAPHSAAARSRTDLPSLGQASRM